MREGFVLYAYDPNRDFSVPIARVIMLSEGYKFFQRVWEKGNINAGGFLVSLVLEYIRKNSPEVLASYEGSEFFINTEGLAVLRGDRDKLDSLPLVDLV